MVKRVPWGETYQRRREVPSATGGGFWGKKNSDDFNEVLHDAKSSTLPIGSLYTNTLIKGDLVGREINGWQRESEFF